MKIESYIILFALLPLAFSCSGGPTEQDPLESPNFGKLSFSINMANAPEDVVYVKGLLYRDDQDDVEFNFINNQTHATAFVENLVAGEWHLQVDAYNEQNVIIYTGASLITIISGQTVTVNLHLNSVTGSIEIIVTWGNSSGYEIFNYDFNDNSLAGWHGPASAQIIDGELHLSSIQGWNWHSISPSQQVHYKEGEIEVDIYPRDGRYSFETKGNSLSNGFLEWGIFTHFRRDSLYVSQNENNTNSQVFTGFIYEPNTWYTLRFKFNNQAGEKGKFDFWIKPRFEGSTEIYIGEFDYLARYGRLEGVWEFVLSTGDPQLSNVREGVFDNIKLSVK